MSKLIIIPTYNEKENIEKIILKVFSLDIDFDILIVDDGSQMSSREVFENFNKELNISYFYIENKGPALARNFGVSKAKGEWIIFFDSDCTKSKTLCNKRFKIPQREESSSSM